LIASIPPWAPMIAVNSCCAARNRSVPSLLDVVDFVIAVTSLLQRMSGVSSEDYMAFISPTT